EAEHRILLVRLVARAADEVGVLVRLEVREAHDHRLGSEGGGDLSDAFGELLDVEAHRVRIAGHLRADLLLEVRVQALEFEQRLRVHTDHAVDDELKPGGPPAVVGDGGEIEGAVGIADIHHDLHGYLRQRIELDLLALELQQPRVHVAAVALGARHRDLLSLADALRGIATADHRGDPELARDDGGVAGAAAAVGDDRRRALHDRLPVRIGHVGAESIAVLHARHLARAGDRPRGAGTDAGTDAAPGGEHLAAALERIALNGAPGTTLHGLGARLQDIDGAAFAIARPLDVHRPLVVLF